MKKESKNKMMTYGLILALVGLSYASSIVSADSNEETITYTVHLESFEIIEKENGHEIIAKNFGRLLVPGKPNMPSKIFSLAIPPGAKVTDVTVTPDDVVVLSGEYYILPCPVPDTIGRKDYRVYYRELSKFQENKNQVYTTDDPYPSTVGEFVQFSHYRKYDLVDVRVNPFTYYPSTKQLQYYPSITIKITYEAAGDEAKQLRDSLVRTEKTAEKIIANYEQAQLWYQQEPLGKGTFDFVIITIDSLNSSITPLVNWETSKGRTVKVVTTSWIDANYNGYDLQEKMRNFLRDKYPSSEWGIEDVLLVGHYDDVPMRRTWQDMGYGKPETDYYYAELSLPDNQSWDADGDHRWGEDYGDTIDFYAEVNVGRIPWSDPGTVMHICNKSVAYEQNNDMGFKKNILLLGAFFWWDTDNAVLMETKVNQPWMSDWTMTRMYEQGQSSYPMDYNLDYNNVQTVWSSGTYAFVDWAGHGSPTACYEYYPSQPFVDTNTCNYLNDDYPAIIFADACSNSDTDNLNIGQAMLKQGAVGFLGSTKVAYGMHAWDDPYDGSSQSLDYFFTTCVTSLNYTQGQAQQWALIEMYTNSLWYYPKYETFEWGALWGNPDLGMMPYPSTTLFEITNLSAEWNFISLPFQLSVFEQPVNKNDIIVRYNEVDYNWSDAVAAGIISDYIFGWNRTDQYYEFIDILEPGYGYWMYAYDDCELWVQGISNPPFNGIISDLASNWNVVGYPTDQSINKNDITVSYNGTDYTWADAVAAGIISDYLFGWDRIAKSYIFSDTLEPGYCYWTYAYHDCTLKA